MMSELKFRPLWPIRDCTYTKRLSPAFEERQESMERIAQIEEHFAAQELAFAFRGVSDGRALRIEISFMLAQKAARAGDGESFVVQQTLDAEDHVHVFLAVEAMSAGTFDRLEHGELGF